MRLLAILALARTTLAEAIRDRILYGLLGFATALVLLSGMISDLTVGFRLRIVTDLSLSAISLAGTLMATLLGVSSVAREVERRTVIPLLAKPIARWEYILGKYLGVLATTLLNVALMLVAATAMISLYRGEDGNPDFAWSAYFTVVGLLVLRLAVIAAIAVFFSSFTSSTVAFISTLGITLAGYLSSEVRFFLERNEMAVVRYIGRAVYYVVPDLAALDPLPLLIHNVPILTPATAFAALYALLYSAAAVTLATRVFARRDLV